MTTPTPSPSNYYVDKEEFQEAMVRRRAAVDYAKEHGLEIPPVEEYIGKCILDIAQHLAYKYNFIGYSFRDEMISDGIENCLRYIDNYDCVNYKNPFAYFTQINYYAFVRRIGREKKQSAIKAKLIREIPMELFALQGHEDDGEFHHAFMDYLQQNDMTDTTIFDKKPAAKRGRKKKTELPDNPFEEFIDEPIPLPHGLLQVDADAEDEDYTTLPGYEDENGDT
jgi:hypothetical protein